MNEIRNHGMALNGGWEFLSCGCGGCSLYRLGLHKYTHTDMPSVVTLYPVRRIVNPFSHTRLNRSLSCSETSLVLCMYDMQLAT